MTDTKLKGGDVHATVYVDAATALAAEGSAERYVRSNFLPENVRAEFEKNTVKTMGGFQVEVHASIVAETREVPL